MKIRKFLSICLVLALLSGASACGGGSTDSTSGDDGGEGSGDMTSSALTMADISTIRTALGANNPYGMAPGLALGAITLPECAATGITDATYAILNLPAWLSFDSSTRILSLATGTLIPNEANTSAEVTYGCASASDPTVNDSETFVINDLDGGGIVDGLEYKFGHVPLVNDSSGWVWLNPANVDIYRTPASSPRKIQTLITKPTSGMDAQNASDAAADFDGDGVSNADEITAGSDIFVAQSTGMFAFDSKVETGDSPAFISSADFNNDGKLDLVVANRNSKNISVLTNAGDGTFTGPANYDIPDGFAERKPWDVATADINNDGWQDIVATAQSIGADDSVFARWINNKDGTFPANPDLAVNINAPYGIVVSDFDGDGNVDAGFSRNDSSELIVELGGGDGTFTAANYTTNGQPTSIITCDVDGDGDIDTVQGDDDHTSLTIINNNGSGQFTVSTTPALPAPSRSLSCADMDNDGDMDILSVNAGSPETLSVYKNNGDGSFAAPSNIELNGTKPYDITTADFDGDGDIDVAITKHATHKVAAFFNDGTGALGNEDEYATDPDCTSPWGIIAFDANNDGKLDLAVSCYGTDKVFIYLNQ